MSSLKALILLTCSTAACAVSTEGDESTNSLELRRGNAPASLAAVSNGASLLRNAIANCTIDQLWLKDAKGDLNAGPMLRKDWPRVQSATGSELVFVKETLAMFSEGGIRGNLVLRLDAVDSRTGEWTVSGRVDNAEWGGFTGNGSASVTLGAFKFNPRSPLVLNDATTQSPTAIAQIVFQRSNGSNTTYQAKWALVQSPSVFCD